jgi:hypothetical protein
VGSQVELHDGSLTGLDCLDIDAIALPMYSRMTQPLGVSGYVDWRMCGRIGRMILSSTFTGAAGESLLMPSMGRFGVDRVFLFGLGSEEEGGGPGRVSRQLATAADVLWNAGVREFAFGAPDSAKVDFASTRMVEIWLKVLGHRAEQFDRVVLLDADGALDAFEPQLKQTASSLGLRWGYPEAEASEAY